MKGGVNSQDKQKMVRMFKDGAGIKKVSKTLNVKPQVIESFAKYYRDNKELKKAPKD